MLNAVAHPEFVIRCLSATIFNYCVGDRNPCIEKCGSTTQNACRRTERIAGAFVETGHFVETPRHAMRIRRAVAADREILLDIWLRAVRATHTFLSEQDIQTLLPLVQGYLASCDAELWVLCSDGGVPIGFMGMSGSKMESLFLAPEYHRQGGGRLLVRYAQELHSELTTDVNEQSPAARQFYEACGFVVVGRSEHDGAGRPFLLLHMRLAARHPSRV